eukprot:scaffold40651_cov63-Phaeocystis_antarctica.AAC.4
MRPSSIPLPPIDRSRDAPLGPLFARLADDEPDAVATQCWAPRVRCPRTEVARTPQPRARCRYRLGSRAAPAAQRAAGGGSGCPPMGRGRLACTAAAPPAAESAVRACGGLQRRARRHRRVACLIPAWGGAGQHRAAAGRAEASAVSACRLGRYAVAAAVAEAARGTEGLDTDAH